MQTYPAFSKIDYAMKLTFGGPVIQKKSYFKQRMWNLWKMEI